MGAITQIFHDSAETRKIKKTATRRRQNQNVEIKELGALLPWPPGGPIPSSTGSGGGQVDKISVLRLTTAFMKFKSFWQQGKAYV